MLRLSSVPDVPATFQVPLWPALPSSAHSLALSTAFVTRPYLPRLTQLPLWSGPTFLGALNDLCDQAKPSSAHSTVSVIRPYLPRLTQRPLWPGPTFHCSLNCLCDQALPSSAHSLVWPRHIATNTNGTRKKHAEINNTTQVEVQARRIMEKSVTFC